MRTWNFVSILVLLEVGREDFFYYGYLVKSRSFNPCFAGSWSRSAPELIAWAKDIMFQSLFCWKLVEKALSAFLTLQTHRVSILVLLEVGREVNEFYLHIFHLVVSILVLLEVGREGEFHLECMRDYIGFQSLFCWKLVEKRF